VIEVFCPWVFVFVKSLDLWWQPNSLDRYGYPLPVVIVWVYYVEEQPLIGRPLHMYVLRMYVYIYTYICVCVCMYICMYLRKYVRTYVCTSAWNNLDRVGRIFMKFDICWFLQNLSKNLKFDQKLTRITCTLHEDLSIFMIIYCKTLL
jgi:hypothetical protein